jgi:glutathione S-transferase
MATLEIATLEIIGIPLSNYVRSLRMLCEEKGIAYTLTPARPHSPEVLAIHPAGQVPCMRHGDVTLFESRAIAGYIDQAFPGPKLFPQELIATAKTEQWISFANVKVDRWIMREFVVPSVFFDKATGPDHTRIAAALPEIEKCAATLDKAVAATGYLVGNGLTYADCNVTPMLASAQSFPQGREIIGRHAALAAYVTAMTARASFKNTAPPPRA